MEVEGVGDAEAVVDMAQDAVTTRFERALEGLEATGASATMRQLVALLAKHGSEEGRMLAEYEHLAHSTNDRAAKYVIDVILQDERLHHHMLVQLATAMAWNTLEGTDMSVPPLGWHMDEKLRAATRRLREFEEMDRRELEALRKRLRPYEETTLWALIVDIMLLDTQKHARILRFLERHARGR
jgi:hypothetical protein